MGKLYLCLIASAIACLVIGSNLCAEDAVAPAAGATAIELPKDAKEPAKEASKDASKEASTEAAKEPPVELVWVGVQLATAKPGEAGEFLIGTIEKPTMDAIELGKYNQRFVRISNLRDEEEYEYRSTTYIDAEDRYDWGIILVLYDDIEAIQFKKGDPLVLQQE